MNKTEAMKHALDAITQYLAESPDPSEEAVENLCDARAVLGKTLAQPAQKRPQNCGTGYCSCIECVMEPAQQDPVALKWQQAPVKTQWGDDMVVASVAIDKDHTVCLYCERDQTPKVDAMFAQRTWVDPNDKTQKQYLPHIGEPVLFCHKGMTYMGKHTGGSFQSEVTNQYFNTWECHWMYLPAAHSIKEQE